MKTVTIDPVTRIEGHAKITIHLDDDAHEVLELDAVARLEARALDRLRPHARRVKLLLRIVFVGEDDLPRNLAVNAYRLHAFENADPRSFEHRAV